MTEPYSGKLVIRIVRGESVSASEIAKELELLDARIQQEGIKLPRTIHSEVLEAGTQHRSAVEHVIDNRRINREGRSEAYLDLDPAESNYPPRSTASRPR